MESWVKDLKKVWNFVDIATLAISLVARNSIAHNSELFKDSASVDLKDKKGNLDL